jgi:hypothetical protein
MGSEKPAPQPALLVANSHCLHRVTVAASPRTPERMAKSYWLEHFTTDSGLRLSPSDGQPAAAVNEKHRIKRCTDELLGLVKGILADGVVELKEADFLRGWLHANMDVTKSFPGREVFRRVERTFADGVVTDEEREDLKLLLESITGQRDEPPPIPANPATRALFDNPEPPVVFVGESFSLTGKFVSGTRGWCVQQVEAAGGEFHAEPRASTRYLVVGTLGSRDWAHSSFGRKIEAAIKHRPPLAVISEQHWVKHFPWLNVR